MDNNPVVRFLAVFGLSPSPLETIFGIKSLFSGMTEGLYQILNLSFEKAIKANIFSPLIIPLLLYLLFMEGSLRLDTRYKENIFFAGFVFLSFLVNIFN